MKVLVDTCVWSAILRRADNLNNINLSAMVRELIEEQRLCIIGAIRQELLSGIKSETHFTRLKNYLNAFPDIPCDTIDYCHAATLFNQLRSHGIQASHIDALICAIAKQHHLAILTLDQDFVNYGKILELKIVSVE